MSADIITITETEYAEYAGKGEAFAIPFGPMFPTAYVWRNTYPEWHGKHFGAWTVRDSGSFTRRRILAPINVVTATLNPVAA